MNKLKVLHFITSLKMGGAENALCNLLEHWNEHKKDCDIQHSVAYFYDGPCVEKIKKLNIPIYQIKGFICPYDFIAFGRFSKLVKKINPDIIHSALWSANIMARFVAKKHGIPLVCDLHGDCRYHGGIRNFFERVTLMTPKRFIAVSHSVQKSFLGMFGKNKNVQNKTIVIQNGIDAEKIRIIAQENRLSRKDLGFKKGDFVIGAVGRLCKIKRYDFLIKSFAKFLKHSSDAETSEKAKLCIVGNGPERLFLEKLVGDLGVKNNVLFAGEQNNIYKYYPIFDCFVVSSQSEGLSIALLEALSFGLPVVTTGEGGAHDVVTDGINGFIVLVGDCNNLCDALTTLYTNENMRVSISKANKNLIEGNFKINRVADQYIDLYNQVL